MLVNFGVMGLFGIPLDGLTSAISAMAVGIGADYAMYFLFRIREELQGGVPLEAALGRALMTSGKAVLFVSSAIAVGYATLCLSSFAFHVKLGGAGRARDAGVVGERARPAAGAGLGRAAEIPGHDPSRGAGRRCQPPGRLTTAWISGGGKPLDRVARDGLS